MGSDTSPTWLVPAFARAAAGAGANAPSNEIDAAARRLLDRWQEPRRHFHNVRHLVELLEHVDELQQETTNAHLVRLAAWYHGAVFSADAEVAQAQRGGEDEAASAEYARKELEALGVPDERIETVATMVRALRRHDRSPKTMDCAVLCDADLSVLASEPRRYREYVTDVRAEYAHISDREFLEARRNIVAKLLARDRLYTSPLAGAWEVPARNNLQAELSRLDKALSELPQHN
jgi:predicted metal-dependent HD superfamily phosphohydrolase